MSLDALTLSQDQQPERIAKTSETGKFARSSSLHSYTATPVESSVMMQRNDRRTMFKILNNLIDIDFHSFFSLSTVANTRGHRFKLTKPVCNSNIRLFSFSCRRIDCWNSLPDNLVNCKSLHEFKSRLNSVNFSKHLILTFWFGSKSFYLYWTFILSL